MKKKPRNLSAIKINNEKASFGFCMNRFPSWLFTFSYLYGVYRFATHAQTSFMSSG